MERLTIRNSDGSVSQPTATTIQAVFEKLAAYEDTGLSPRQITMAMDTLKLCDSIGVMRMNEILDAERDGRLVVLPCKVGDELWFEKNGKIQCETIDRMVVDLTDEDDDWYIAIYTMSASVLSEDIGRLAWLTRADAEAAMKAEKALEVSENEPI